MTAASSNSEGFTLLELLIVFAIMLLVSAVVLPQFARSIDQFQLQKSAREMAAVLREARNIAVSRAQEITFSLNADDSSYAITSRDKRYELPRGVAIGYEATGALPTIVGTSADAADRIVFHPDGSASGARLSLSIGGRSYRIAVDWMTGNVDVSR